MNLETSPFSPGQPVPNEFFVGRVDEIRRLHGMVKASVRGRFKIGFISGERGIGKSSLASFVRHLSEQESEVAGCHVFLGGVHGLQEMLEEDFQSPLEGEHGQVVAWTDPGIFRKPCPKSGIVRRQSWS